MASLPKQFSEGEVVEVLSAKGERLGAACINKGRSILGYMLAFGNETIEEALEKRILSAALMRRRLFDPKKTNAIRLINAEGDGIPGLIVDSYADVFVMQISNPGIEKLKGQILEKLIALKPRAIVEKSTSFLRKKEGLSEVRAHLYGEPLTEVEILEKGLRYSVDLFGGQKTGLFLDMREMRALVRELGEGKRVLNCFAYTGGFSISALAGGAALVDSVEISAKCGPKIEANLALNQLPKERHRFFAADVFDFFKTAQWDYDLVILDPPAFLKKREDIATAFRAYKELNRHAMEKMASGSLLLTCSCSYHVDEALFQNILFRAALEANRSVRIIERLRSAHDHPLSIYHPESSYLKSFLLYLE